MENKQMIRREREKDRGQLQTSILYAKRREEKTIIMWNEGKGEEEAVKRKQRGQLP